MEIRWIEVSSNAMSDELAWREGNDDISAAGYACDKAKRSVLIKSEAMEQAHARRDTMYESRDKIEESLWELKCNRDRDDVQQRLDEMPRDNNERVRENEVRRTEAVSRRSVQNWSECQ